MQKETRAGQGVFGYGSTAGGPCAPSASFAPVGACGAQCCTGGRCEAIIREMDAAAYVAPREPGGLSPAERDALEQRLAGMIR